MMLKKVLLTGLFAIALLIASGATASAQGPHNVDIQALNDLLSDVADALERSQRVEELNNCIVLARQVYDWPTVRHCQWQLDQITQEMAFEQIMSNVEARRELWRQQQEQWRQLQIPQIPQIPPISSIYAGPTYTPPPVRIEPFPSGSLDHTPRFHNGRRVRGPHGRR